jgi:hypothetical protein
MLRLLQQPVIITVTARYYPQLPPTTTLPSRTSTSQAFLIPKQTSRYLSPVGQSSHFSELAGRTCRDNE